MILALLILAAPGDRAAIDRWRESIELDLAAEVVAEAPARVEPRTEGAEGGDLADDGEAIGLLARALAAVGEEARAEALLADAKPSEATQDFVETASARLALGRDDLAAARRTLLAEPGADPPVRQPSIPECWLLAGRALARGGDPQRAAPLLERFLEMAPLDAEAPAAWYALARAAIDAGDEARAAELTRRAAESGRWQDFYRTRRLQVREHPDEPLPRLGIAELFLAGGAPARARDCAADLVARHPAFERGWLALARANRALGGTEEAERAYARYRELGGEEPLAPR